MKKRPRSFVRDGLGLVWLTAAVIVALVHREIPDATWLMVHLVLLGALTQAILVWSSHFSQALLRTTPKPNDNRYTEIRLWTYALGALAVFIGVPTAIWPMVVAGASAVTVAVLWHAGVLVRDMRRALPGRFRITLRYYLAAAASLPVGAAFGAVLAFGLGDEWHARFLMAHSLVNLLGWVGLTVTGTLVTLWPTVLRTRMDDRADRLARQSLPVLAASVVVAPTGALLGWHWLVVVGLAGYLAGIFWWGRALIQPARTKPPRSFAAASVGLALIWFVVAIVWTSVVIATAPTPVALAEAYPTLAGVFAVGFAAQILAGALSYLIPSVVGNGPAAVKVGNAWFDKFGSFRLLTTNAGLALFLMPVPSWVKVTVSGLVLVALASFLVVFAGAIRGMLAIRIADPEAPRVTAAAEVARPFWTSGQLVAALAALALVVTVGVGIDPGAAGLPTSAGVGGAAPGGTASVTPTGEVTRVTVEAKDMRYTPDVIDVPAGNQLVIDLVNTDPTTTHDLVVGGVRTARLLPGERAELDVGVVGASTQGWCSVAGHRQMGMTLEIRVAGESAPAAGGMGGMSGMGGMGGMHEETAGTDPASTTPTIDATTLLTQTVDAELGPLTKERVHKLTLTVTEVPLEVAPGVWQTRWTFNGKSVGPTLHGRVGDVFDITLVNDGTMGHSIDFHAGELAPDKPMRTIPPGESLTYRFTATRSGIWMYHCSTHPMTAHIAAGMHGAVIIEPDNLPEVDRSYVLVQSEVYLANQATTAGEATEVDTDAVLAERPSLVAFNGIANQYDQAQFTAKVGERVRFWVLDAGPNRATSFHIVGGQFDTSYMEGVYSLRRGKGAFGETDAGSQALGLQPAQGGFVELTFPEAGHYPVVSHVMVDAERGAHGIVNVTEG